MQPDSSNPRSELAILLRSLQQSLERDNEDVVDLADEVIVLSDVEPVTYAFVKGRPRKSVHEAWGENDRSYWAHVHALPDAGEGVEYVVTLERDGATMSCLGVFRSEQDALKALGRHGRFEKP